jgi:hypothetical protein
MKNTLAESSLENFSSRFSLLNFKNREGEGVVSSIKDTNTGKINDILIGNEKIRTQFKVKVSVS